MIVRDKDVLRRSPRRAGCSVCISVPCVDEDVWRQLEPGTAPPLQRLRAVRELVDAGIRAGVLMNPIVPGISSKPALLERTVKAIADHGARFVGCNVMFLEGGTRDHFMRWLAAGVPASWSMATAALRRQVRAGGVPQGGLSADGDAEEEVRRAGRRVSDEDDSRRRRRPGENLALPTAATVGFDDRSCRYTAIAFGSADATRRGPTASTTI